MAEPGEKNAVNAVLAMPLELVETLSGLLHMNDFNTLHP
jgi:hypothetical protein